MFELSGPTALGLMPLTIFDGRGWGLRCEVLLQPSSMLSCAVDSTPRSPLDADSRRKQRRTNITASQTIDFHVMTHL
jgi:hypothetical protein